MGIVWSRRAGADIDWIEDYIAQDNPLAALETRDTIETQIKYLKTHPSMGRKGRMPGTRELIVSGLPYIIVYRPKKNAVEIARILHGARQWPL